MIDAHIRIASDGSPNVMRCLKDMHAYTAIKSAVHARKLLEARFTTIREAATHGYTNIATRDAINEGRISGPRMRGQGYWLATVVVGLTLAIPFLLSLGWVATAGLFILANMAVAAGYVALTIVIVEESPAGSSAAVMLRQSTFSIGVASGGALGDAVLVFGGFPALAILSVPLSLTVTSRSEGTASRSITFLVTAHERFTKLPDLFTIKKPIKVNVH